MHKRLLVIPLIFLSFWWLMSAYFLHFYFFTNVEKLSNEYPIFDESVDQYILVKDKPRSWIKLNEISTYAKWAIILSEDWAFYQHEGVDFKQLQIVIEETLKTKRLGRGASTITQQVIKNIFLNDERSLLRKIKEIMLAYKLETFVMKNKILEHYFNIIELGPQIYGIKAASFYYFNKHPKFLLPHEAAFLAMLLPSPVKYSLSFKRKSLTHFARKTVNKILYKMKIAKIISLDEYHFYKAQKLSFELY